MALAVALELDPEPAGDEGVLLQGRGRDFLAQPGLDQERAGPDAQDVADVEFLRIVDAGVGLELGFGRLEGLDPLGADPGPVGVGEDEGDKAAVRLVGEIDEHVAGDAQHPEARRGERDQVRPVVARPDIDELVLVDDELAYQVGLDPVGAGEGLERLRRERDRLGSRPGCRRGCPAFGRGGRSGPGELWSQVDVGDAPGHSAGVERGQVREDRDTEPLAREIDHVAGEAGVAAAVADGLEAPVDAVDDAPGVVDLRPVRELALGQHLVPDGLAPDLLVLVIADPVGHVLDGREQAGGSDVGVVERGLPESLPGVPDE